MPKKILKYEAIVNDVWQICANGRYKFASFENYNQASRIARLLNNERKVKKLQREYDETLSALLSSLLTTGIFGAVTTEKILDVFARFGIKKNAP